MIPQKKRNVQAKLSYCEKCGKLFSSAHGETLCPTCNAEYQAAQSKIREYLRENPKATLMDAAAVTGVDSDSMKRISQEVVSAKFNAQRAKANVDHPCAMCGTPIKSGTYCPACTAELQKKAQQVAAANASPVAPAQEEKPRVVKGLDEDFNKALVQKPAKRRMYQGVIEERRK